MSKYNYNIQKNMSAKDWRSILDQLNTLIEMKGVSKAERLWAVEDTETVIADYATARKEGAPLKVTIMQPVDADSGLVDLVEVNLYGELDRVVGVTDALRQSYMETLQASKEKAKEEARKQKEIQKEMDTGRFKENTAQL